MVLRSGGAFETTSFCLSCKMLGSALLFNFYTSISLYFFGWHMPGLSLVCADFSLGSSSRVLDSSLGVFLYGLF